MSIDLNNFSSIFELMCGYNFVNSFGNEDIFRFIDITYNIRNHIDDKLKNIQGNITSISEKHKTTKPDYIDHLFSFFDLQRQYEKLRDKNITHEFRSHTLYLMGGIFSFIILLYCGLMSEMQLYINLFLSIVAMVLIAVCFLYVPYLVRQRKLIKSSISLFCLSVLFYPQLRWLNSFFNDNDKFKTQIHILILYALCLLVVVIPTIIDLINKSIIKKELVTLNIVIENRINDLQEFETSITKSRDDINPFL